MNKERRKERKSKQENKRSRERNRENREKNRGGNRGKTRERNRENHKEQKKEMKISKKPTPHELNPDIIIIGKELYTINLTPTKEPFEITTHKRITINNKEVELRRWDPKRSKLGAAIKKGLKRAGLKEDATILYLGASHGYTPSFVSDITPKGKIYALDFAPRVVKDLVFLCEERENMAPILADANKPEEYQEEIEPVDVIFQDIAQKNQVSIFIKNCDQFLKKEGYGIIAIKARSIDVTRKPEEIFKKIRKELDQLENYNIIDYRELAPYEQDHALIVIKKKK